jgi:hypothetical protein
MLHIQNNNPADMNGLLGSGVFDGFSMQDFQDLQKALEAGHPDPTYEGGGSGWPLITQSIEGSLTYATATEEHCRLWRQIPKDPKRLTSTVHEFSSVIGLGPDTDFSMPEGSAGPLINADLRRASKYVRFMSHKREISDPLNLLSNLVGGSPAIEQMNQWASTWMVLQLEQNLLWGDSDIHPYSIDGLAKICKDAGHIVDMRGEFLSSDRVYDQIVKLVNPPNYGNPTHLWMSVDTKADFAKVGGSHVKFDIPPNYAGSQTFKMGIEPIGITSPVGTTIGFETSVFLAAKGGPLTTAIGEDIPTLPVITTTTSLDGTNLLFTTDDYGTYMTKFVACGIKGKSAPGSAITSVINSTHNKISHSIAAPTIDNVLYYTEYRTKVNGTEYYEIRKIPQARDGNGVVTATVVEDVNANLPDTMSAFLIENTPKAWQWKQLLDFARVALARNEYKQPFGYCIYGMLICYLPMRFYQFVNIGRATSL